MTLPSSQPALERSQPWLGTFVRVRVLGLTMSETQEAIEAAFHEVATVHHLMSFHDPGSDVSALNRAAALEPVVVHPYTYTVLEQAQAISQASSGLFDITVGAELRACNLLPGSASPGPTPTAAWQDIELLPESTVRLRRPACLDLGGIAKGFAVDKALDLLRGAGAEQAVVNAGGDLGVFGTQPEMVALDLEESSAQVPVIALQEGSLASSLGRSQVSQHRGATHGPHIDGRRRRPVRTDRFVSVLSDRCMMADALTKVVMAAGEESAAVLAQFGATAFFHDPERGWRSVPPPLRSDD